MCRRIWLRLHSKLARRKKVVILLCTIPVLLVYLLVSPRDDSSVIYFYNAPLSRIDFNAEIDTSRVIATVDEKFLSVSMGWKTFVGWNFSAATEKRIITLTKALSPAYVRIGGIASNFVIFQTFDEEVKSKPFGKLTVHINGEDLDRINEMAKNAGWQVLFALSVLRRSTDGSWDPSNPFRIVKYVADKGYKFVWELGNGK